MRGPLDGRAFRIAWRTADSLALCGFLGLCLDEAAPEHSTISRTRRLIDVETPRAVFIPASLSSSTRSRKSIE